MLFVQHPRQSILVSDPSYIRDTSKPDRCRNLQLDLNDPFVSPFKSPALTFCVPTVSSSGSLSSPVTVYSSLGNPGGRKVMRGQRGVGKKEDREMDRAGQDRTM